MIFVCSSYIEAGRLSIKFQASGLQLQVLLSWRLVGCIYTFVTPIPLQLEVFWVD